MCLDSVVSFYTYDSNTTSSAFLFLRMKRHGSASANWMALVSTASLPLCCCCTTFEPNECSTWCAALAFNVFLIRSTCLFVECSYMACLFWTCCCCFQHMSCYQMFKVVLDALAKRTLCKEAALMSVEGDGKPSAYIVSNAQEVAANFANEGSRVVLVDTSGAFNVLWRINAAAVEQVCWAILLRLHSTFAVILMGCIVSSSLFVSLQY